jgi:hypothetical protein
MLSETEQPAAEIAVAMCALEPALLRMAPITRS